MQETTAQVQELISSANLAAIIGVIGTILGTILGCVLTNIAKKGKVDIKLQEWDFFLVGIILGCFGNYKDMDEINQNCADLSGCGYNMKLDIYNDSENNKPLRDIKVVFANEKEVLKSIKPCDTSGDNDKQTETKPVNISPKQEVEFCFGNSFTIEECDVIKKATKVYICYLNEKGKKKKVKIQNYDFSKHF